MANGLYARVAARGFPSSVAAGMTGTGALESEGGPYSPAHGQDVTEQGQYSTLTGFQPEAPPGPAVELLEGTWGLPGTITEPDQTPGYGPGTFRTHAAPVPGWAGSYADEQLLTVRENSAGIHAQDFGALARHLQLQGVPEPHLDIWKANEAGENVLQPVRGPLQAMGGYDTTQGYDTRNRYGFDAGHRERLVATDPQPMFYLDPAERPFIVPQASGTFTPTDAVQGPAPDGQFLDAGDINSTPPTSYAPPPEPDTLTTPQAGGTPSAGWW